MTRFNNHFNNNFGSCRCIAKAWDHCRNRDVSIYQIPNEIEVVGIHDGTDSWVAPVRDEIFSVPIAKLMDELRAGVIIKLPVVMGQPIKTGRRRLIEQGDANPPPDPAPHVLARRRVPLASIPTATRRALLV